MMMKNIRKVLHSSHNLISNHSVTERERTSLGPSSLRALTGCGCSCVSHFAFFFFSLPLLLFIILFCQLLFHPDLEASLRGHSPHLCPFPRCIQRRMCGRSPSLGPRSSPPGSGGGSGSGMWICSLRGHKGQTNRHRRLKIYCLYQPPVRSDGNSALFSQNTSGKYNLSSLRQSLKLGFSHLAMVFKLPSRSCALWAASENHSHFANCWLMTGSFRQLYTKSWGSKGGHKQQKHDYCILTKKSTFVLVLKHPGVCATHWCSAGSACTGPRWSPHTGRTTWAELDCRAGSCVPLPSPRWSGGHGCCSGPWWCLPCSAGLEPSLGLSSGRWPSPGVVASTANLSDSPALVLTLGHGAQ